MDKETLSNYGWIVICVLVLAVMIALAGPFGTFVAGAVKSTTAGLFGVNQNALGAAGIEIGDQAFANCEHLETEIRNATADYSGDTCCKECGTVLTTGTYVIPTGGKYTAADGTVYNPGDAYPETVTNNDKYEYGDYSYRYLTESNGWRVSVRSKQKETYGPILDEINGKLVTDLKETFMNCNNLITVPVLPKGAINLYNLFANSAKIKTYVGSTDPDGDFSNYIIPSSVTNMRTSFYGCELITDLPTIPEGVTDISYAFQDCYSLIDLGDYIIPNSVNNMENTFKNCTSLTTAPTIPSSVTNMRYTFYGCTSLTGTIIINATPSSNCTNCFYNVDMSKITLTGTSAIKLALANTGLNSSQVTIIN